MPRLKLCSSCNSDAFAEVSAWPRLPQAGSCGQQHKAQLALLCNTPAQQLLCAEYRHAFGWQDLPFKKNKHSLEMLGKVNQVDFKNHTRTLHITVVSVTWILRIEKKKA